MKKYLFKLAWCTGLAFWFSTSFARQGVPVVDFVDVPSPLANSTPDQVRRAIITAAVSERWDVEATPEGGLTLTLLDKAEHTVVVRVTWSATSYSLRYLSSDGLNYIKGPAPLNPVGWDRQGLRDPAADAAAAQRARFRNLASQQYGVARPTELIHPSYELWLHELIAAVRRQMLLPALIAIPPENR